MFLNCSGDLFHRSIADRTKECSTRVLREYFTKSLQFLRLHCDGSASDFGNRDLK